MEDDLATLPPQPREGPIQFARRAWASFLAARVVTRVAVVLGVASTLWVGLAGFVAGFGYSVDALLGIRSAFDPGPWPLMLPLSLMGYLAVPAVVGLLVALAVERATAIERVTADELQEQVVRALIERLPGPGLVGIEGGGHEDDDPTP